MEWMLRMKKWKLMLGGVLAGMLLMAGAVHAEGDKITVIIEGREVDFGKSPVIEKGTALVPFRGLFESLGLEVKWIGETKTVIGKGNGVEIELQIDRNTAVVNGEEIELAVATRLLDNSAYVPLRIVGEATGREVNWDQATRTITIGSAPVKASEVEALYRAYVNAGNAEDLEAYLALFHPESPLLENGLLEDEARRVYEQYDVVTEIERFEVVETGESEAVLHAVVTNVNTNDRFFLSNRTEYRLILQKDEGGEWKIYNLETIGIEYLVPEEKLTADADIDAELEKALKDVIVAHVEASEKEDLQAVMATVDPSSPGYTQTKEDVSLNFLLFDLDYELELVNVIEATDTIAYVYSVMLTKKVKGPDIPDTRTRQVDLLKKQEDGSWKIYMTYLMGVEFLK